MEPGHTISSPGDLIGRQALLTEVLDLIDRRPPWLTLVGPPGVGLERILAELHRRLLQKGHPVVLIEPTGGDGSLDAAATDALQSDALKAEEGVALLSLSPEWEEECQALRSVLKNRHPRWTFVAATRTPGVAKNGPLVPVNGLALPDGLALLRDRIAQIRDRQFADDLDADLATSLVNATDGLPAAIDRLASRFALLSGEDLLQSLRDDRTWPFRSPHTSEVAGLNERAIAALTDGELHILSAACLSPGGFEPASLPALTADGTDTGDVIEALNLFTRSGLLYAVPGGSGRRVRAFAALRAHVLAGLDDDTRDELETRWRSALTSRARELRHDRRGPRGAQAIAHLAAEETNLEEALRQARALGDDPTATDLLLSLIEVRRYRGLPLVARHEESLLSADAQEPEVAHALAMFHLRNARRQEAAQIYTDLHDGGDLRALLTLAELHRTEGDLDAAQALLDQAEPISRVTLGFTAALHAESHRLDQARRALDEMTRHPQPPNDGFLEIQSLQRAGYGCYYLQDYDEQRRLYELALRRADALDDPDSRALILQSLGDNAYARADFPAAVARYEEAQELSHRQPDPHRQAVLHGNLGTILHRGGCLSDAYPHYMESLQGHRSTGASAYEAIVLFALGAFQQERRLYDSARFRYDQALAIWGDDDAFDRGATYLCLAWMHHERGELARAREHRDTALEILDALPDSDSKTAWQALTTATAALLDRDATFEPGELPGSSQATKLVEKIAAFLRPHDDVPEPADDTSFPTLYERLLDGLLFSLAVAPVEPPPAVSQTSQTSQSSQGEPQTPAATDQPVDLYIDHEARWFLVPGEEQVDIRRRKAARLILRKFLDTHASNPPVAFDVDELFAIGWPDQTIHPKSAADRVYWVIRTLRDLGLRDLLVTTGDGYSLDPAAHIHRCQQVPDDD